MDQHDYLKYRGKCKEMSEQVAAKRPLVLNLAKHLDRFWKPIKL